MSAADKLKFGGPLKGLNKKKATQIQVMKEAGMASKKDIQWLNNYNKSLNKK